MTFKNILIAVSNMEKSKKFYHDILNLDVIADFGANVTLTGGITLQTLDTWKLFIRTDHVVLPNNACELYFEEDDMDIFYGHIRSFNINYVHRLLEHSWGQRVIRFYDPDNHIIEVGEKLNAVVKRFLTQGLTEKETAIRMDIPVDYVHACLEGNK